jgi:hypothetical protein
LTTSILTSATASRSSPSIRAHLQDRYGWSCTPCRSDVEVARTNHCQSQSIRRTHGAPLGTHGLKVEKQTRFDLSLDRVPVITNEGICQVSLKQIRPQAVRFPTKITRIGRGRLQSSSPTCKHSTSMRACSLFIDISKGSGTHWDSLPSLEYTVGIRNLRLHGEHIGPVHTGSLSLIVNDRNSVTHPET